MTAEVAGAIFRKRGNVSDEQVTVSDTFGLWMKLPSVTGPVIDSELRALRDRAKAKLGDEIEGRFEIADGGKAVFEYRSK
jgi:hypothetical protein